MTTRISIYLLLKCSNYIFLNDADRAITYSEKVWPKCDLLLPVGWYMFSGSAGAMMATSCVHSYGESRCATDVPGWFQGHHPSPSEGAIQAKVCFQGDTCCDDSVNIRVRNCGEFYVYEIKPAPRCNLRYCGQPGKTKRLKFGFYSLKNVPWRNT